MFQRTRIPHVQNGLVSDASLLLHLGGLAVDRVASDLCTNLINVRSHSTASKSSSYIKLPSAFVAHQEIWIPALPSFPGASSGADGAKFGWKIGAASPNLQARQVISPLRRAHLTQLIRGSGPISYRSCYLTASC